MEIDDLEERIDRAIEEKNFEELLDLLKRRAEILKTLVDKGRIQELKKKDEERIKILKREMEKLKNEAIILKRARNEYKKLLDLMRKGEDIGRA
ncbi:MAG: hypothetical protein B5M49_03695 [Thermotoga sp. 4484_232]|nr:MAG: hypothetical protein B5M49_03695 [Thermotoga sp. 4484_232]RKX41315.1 MAG: hypothetical protein DRP23_00970 [Thermotogota bacterium]RKX52390.1 MAG: hypothetical protein DRP25_02435 [Thermotoga sp.]RKX55981.1 MAG: hypothetical protein DRP24_04005 [Thermotoga sp.]